MTDRRYYSTAQACAALGVTRMTLVTIWREEPSRKMPGKTGPMLWSLGRIRRIAMKHGREVDLDVLT